MLSFVKLLAILAAIKNNIMTLSKLNDTTVDIKARVFTLPRKIQLCPAFVFRL